MLDLIKNRREHLHICIRFSPREQKLCAQLRLMGRRKYHSKILDNGASYASSS
jgi:hypothetical protein